MKVLIFGANGQDGYYLSGACRKRQMEVIGISRSGPWLSGDVASPEIVEELIRKHQPAIIFHLAATSTTGHEAIYEHHATIGAGTINILESVKRWSRGSKVFITGSGLQFINNGQPISETDPFDHASSYAAARNYSVYLSRYFRNLGIQTYIGYLFHHESPLRRPTHVSQKIVQAVKHIAVGSDEKLELGDISVEKEWAFAGDITEGMAVLMGQDQVFEAVIGTGKTHTIEDWLKICFASIGKDWTNHVILRDGFTSEYKRLFSNPETMYSLGWRPMVDFVELAELMLRS